MVAIILYVKSRKFLVSQSSYFTYGLNIGDGYFKGFPETTQATEYTLEDQEAINILNQAKIAYTLIDLNRCSLMTRLKAKFNRIKTPTLFLDGKKVVGVKKIKEALKDVKT